MMKDGIRSILSLVFCFICNIILFGLVYTTRNLIENTSMSTIVLIVGTIMLSSFILGIIYLVKEIKSKSKNFIVFIVIIVGLIFFNLFYMLLVNLWVILGIAYNLV